MKNYIVRISWDSAESWRVKATSKENAIDKADKLRGSGKEADGYHESCEVYEARQLNK